MVLSLKKSLKQYKKFIPINRANQMNIIKGIASL